MTHQTTPGPYRSRQSFPSVFRVVCPPKSDISVFQVLQLNSVCLVVLSVTFPMAVRAVGGPMSFPAAFIATEALKVFELFNCLILKRPIQGGSLNLCRFCQLFCGSSAFVHLGFQVCHFHNSYLLITSLSNCQKGVEKFATMLTKFMQRL